MLGKTPVRFSLQMLQEPLPHEEKTAARGMKTFARLSSSQTMRVGAAAGLVGAALVASVLSGKPAEAQ